MEGYVWMESFEVLPKLFLITVECGHAYGELLHEIFFEQTLFQEELIEAI